MLLRLQQRLENILRLLVYPSPLIVQLPPLRLCRRLLQPLPELVRGFPVPPRLRAMSPPYQMLIRDLIYLFTSRAESESGVWRKVEYDGFDELVRELSDGRVVHDVQVDLEVMICVGGAMLHITIRRRCMA